MHLEKTKLQSPRSQSQIRGSRPIRRRGSALAETIFSAGLLALAVPWIHAAWSASRLELEQAEMESISAQVTNACLAQIQAARNGLPSLLPQTRQGLPFPQDGNPCSLGFSADGSLLGSVAPARYQSGCQPGSSATVANPACFVRIVAASPDHANAAAGTSPTAGLLPLRLTIEYPATLPASARRKLVFHTLTP